MTTKMLALAANRCWVIRRQNNEGQSYHVVENVFSTSPHFATVYRDEEAAAILIRITRDGPNAIFEKDDIVEVVPLGGALTIGSLAKPIAKGNV